MRQDSSRRVERRKWARITSLRGLRGERLFVIATSSRRFSGGQSHSIREVSVPTAQFERLESPLVLGQVGVAWQGLRGQVHVGFAASNEFLDLPDVDSAIEEQIDNIQIDFR